jgi:glutaredoxin
MSKFVLFSTSTCSWCRRAKRYFGENRVPFKEIKANETRALLATLCARPDRQRYR